MDIQCGDRALVHDIRYENIRVEIDDVCPVPRMQGSREERYRRGSGSGAESRTGIARAIRNDHCLRTPKRPDSAKP